MLLRNHLVPEQSSHAGCSAASRSRRPWARTSAPLRSGNFIGASLLGGDPKKAGMPLTRDFEPHTRDALTRLSRQHRLGRNVCGHHGFSFGVFESEAGTEGLGGLTSTVGKCGFESRRSRSRTTCNYASCVVLLGGKAAIETHRLLPELL